MKQLKFFPLIALFFLLGSTMMSAQIVDVKLNPMGFIGKKLTGAVEFGATNNIGIEATGGYDWSSFKFDGERYNIGTYKVGGNGRYYFNPKKGLDGFYAGVYGRYAGGKWTRESDGGLFDSKRFAAGFHLGGKVVASNERLIFDFGIGFGRAFVFEVSDPKGESTVNLSNFPLINWDIPIHLSVGYRFGSSSEGARSRRYN